MPNDNPEGIGGSLSLEEAAAAYAKTPDDNEAEDGQIESESEATGHEAASNDDDGLSENEGQAEAEIETPEAPLYVADDAKVKLADGTEVTIAELKNGNLRDKDYRQKTMAAAERERVFSAREQQFQQLEQQMAGDREFMVHLIQSIMPQKPDPSMFSMDPMGYGEQKAFYDARKEQLDYLLGQMQVANQRQQAAAQENYAKTRSREWEATLEKMPELRDSQRLQSFVAEVQRFGGEYGYTPQELAMIGDDHRHAVVLRDAIAFRKLQANKSKVNAKVEGRPPVQRSGIRPTPDMQKARDVKASMDRLNKSGSLRDGVAALLALEKG